MRKILISLWVLGAAIYTANSVVIADRLGLFGGVLGTGGEEAPQGQQTGAVQKTAVERPQLTAEPAEEVNRFPAGPGEAGGWARVLRTVSVRAGPASGAPRLGVVRAGAELQVLRQEGGWVQVRDAEAGATGWVHGSYLDRDAATLEAGLFDPELEGDLFAESGEWEFEEVERPQRRSSSSRSGRREVERPQTRSSSSRSGRRGGSPVGGVAAHFYRQFGR